MTQTMNQTNFNLIKGQMPKTDIDRLMEKRITKESTLPPLKPLFKMFDSPCFYRGELTADCGKAKSGKTTFLSLIMSCAIGQKDLLNLVRTSDDPLKVLWIDTEQSQQSTQEILSKRIFPMADNDLNERLFAFNLRGMGYEARSKMVTIAINHIKPDLVIIDGIKDLMTDINDAVQATIIMEHLMALAEVNNCCIVCVLHQNKSEADRNMRGSIGTELTNKAFEVFQCEMADESGVFKVAQTYSRKQKMKQKLYYQLDDNGLPTVCDNYCEQPRDEKGRWVKKTVNLDLVKFFNDAMEGRTQRKFNELMAVAMKKYGVSDAQAYYRLIREAEEQGIIRKMEHPDTKDTWVELTDDTALPF